MASAKRYWLFKSEPDCYSIDDLERDGSTSWEGVRNYQARNFLRDDARVGDLVLFHHSNADPVGVAGIATILRSGYPDPFQFDQKNRYYDPKSKPENPTWITVDVKFIEKFSETVSLATLKSMPGLEKMVVTQRGSRLSVQPVTKDEFDIVRKLGRARKR
ncbi:MAG: EVE domain-containing protein [Acidobacteria bacterium]|nr:EVE domain-containing protein [Acidobacteriota bacterium]